MGSWSDLVASETALSVSSLHAAMRPEPEEERTCRQSSRSVAPDPLYGPAVRCKRVSSIWRMCGLASMYPASDWSVLCSEPSWISARLRPHYRTGLDRASRVTSVRMRREDRSSISSHPLADLGGIQLVGLRHRSLPILCSSFVRAGEAVPSSRPALVPRRRAQGARQGWPSRLACLWLRLFQATP
jgi:hypothetical protein